MRRMGIFSMAAAMLMVGAAAPMAASHGGPRATLPATPKKQRKAMKRQKAAQVDVAPQYRRSKNPPTKRRLKANLRHVSKRVRRKHRRARRG